MKRDLNNSKERVFLDEAFLNGRKIDKKGSTFLLEVEGGQSYLDRCRSNPDLPIYLIGIIQSGDKPNRNGRIYPWDYLKRECMRYLENEVRQGLSYGELDHPEGSTTPSLTKACHTIEDIWFEGNDVWGKIKVLNAYAPAGDPALKVRSLILNGKNIGISSRALGSLREDTQDGYDVVDEDLEVICWDLVSNASNFGSEQMRLAESKKLLTESQCFGGKCDIKQKPIKEFQFQNLTESEKTYLNILGVERFLRVYKKFGNI